MVWEDSWLLDDSSTMRFCPNICNPPYLKVADIIDKEVNNWDTGIL